MPRTGCSVASGAFPFKLFLQITGMRMNCREFSWSIEKSAGQDFQTPKTRVYPQHRFTKTAVKCLFLNRFSKTRETADPRDFLIPEITFRCKQ